MLRWADVLECLIVVMSLLSFYIFTHGIVKCTCSHSESFFLVAKTSVYVWGVSGDRDVFSKHSESFFSLLFFVC